MHVDLVAILGLALALDGLGNVDLELGGGDVDGVGGQEAEREEETLHYG